MGCSIIGGVLYVYFWCFLFFFGSVIWGSFYVLFKKVKNVVLCLWLCLVFIRICYEGGVFLKWVKNVWEGFESVGFLFLCGVLCGRFLNLLCNDYLCDDFKMWGN